MPPVSLTTRSIEALKPKAARYAVYDRDCPGLLLRVTPSGKKTWSVMYSHGTRQRRLTLGTYPDHGLADARTWARSARVQVDAGADPGAQKQADRAAAATDTFGALAALYIERHAKKRKRSWDEDVRILNRDLLPAWRHTPVRDLKRRTIRELLDEIADRAPVMANRTLALVSKILNFGVDREWLEANPAARLQKPTREVSRERVLTDPEIAQLWAALAAAEAAYRSAASSGRVTEGKLGETPLLRPMLADWLRLRLLTAQRGGEVLRMRWADLDLRAGTWTIPSEVAKNKSAHTVPLSPPALAVLEARRAETDPDVPWVFVNDLRRGPATDRAKKVALSRFLPTAVDVRGHDLRRTAASGMGRLGVPRETIARVLNHVDRGPRATSVYDRFDRLPEKRQALEAWARELERIVTGTAPAKVVPFAR